MGNNADDENSALIKGLGYAAITIAVILLGYLYFDDALEQQRNPNRSPSSQVSDQYVSVVLQRNKFGHYVSSGEINASPVEFFLDTGATHISIPAELEKKLGLTRGRKESVVTANGVVSVYSTVLAQVSIGPIILRNVEANINPYMRGQDILLGMSFLGRLDFSQRGNVLTLKQYTN
ncbi:MAG: TIGR02281 family clan AA aspartic protease [Pseudomonadota bacterium]